MSIVARFYRTAVSDGLLEHSPAEHVRRPHVPAESPTLGLTHLQLEALRAAARDSDNRYDFALVCLLGLLGLRIFEVTGLDIADLGEEHGHRVVRVLGKGDKTVLVVATRPPPGRRKARRAKRRPSRKRPNGSLLAPPEVSVKDHARVISAQAVEAILPVTQPAADHYADFFRGEVATSQG